jgi:hypothetical protein
MIRPTLHRSSISLGLIALATAMVTSASLRSAPATDLVLIGSYSFDDGGGGPDPMGWTTIDFTDRGGPFFHIDDFAGLNGGSFGGLTPLAGARSLWCGARPSAAFCTYVMLPGYSCNWNEAFTSVPMLVTGNVNVSFLARFDSEPDYDFAYLEYFTESERWHTLRGFDGTAGNSFVSESIPADSLAGTVRIRIRFASDGGYDDGDGGFDSDGGVLIDNLVIADASGVVDSQDFEIDAVGALATTDGDWTASETPAFGDYAGLFEGTEVLQEDPITTNGTNLWGFFKDSSDDYGCGGHPEQAVIPYGHDGLALDNGLVSPVIDLAPFLSGGNLPDSTAIVVEYDIYLDKHPLFPNEEGVRHLVYVRSRLGGCWEQWNGVAFVGGGSGEWYRKSFDVSPMIDPGATHVQIVFKEFNYLEEACRSHAPLIDNIAIYATGVTTSIADARTGAFSLDQNYPNPFNPATRVRYEVPAPGTTVSLRIYDVTGRMVRTLEDGFVGPGLHVTHWDGTNEIGERVGSGVYFCRLAAPGVSRTRKMVLLR